MNYEAIEFQIPVREGFYRYRQKVSPAYLVTDIGIPWASIVVHRKPGTPDDRWFVSEFATGDAIDIPDTTSRDELSSPLLPSSQHSVATDTRRH